MVASFRTYDRMPPETKDLFYAYIRISPTECVGKTKEEREESAQRRIGLQRTEITNYINYNYPGAIVKWYEDLLISGYNKKGDTLKNRVALQTLMFDAIKNKPKSVIFTKIDRFARTAKELLDLSSKLKENGTEIIMTSMKVDTNTAYGKMFYTLLGAFAEFEHDMIIMRTTDGKHTKRALMEAEGRNWGGVRYRFKNKVTGETQILTPKQVDEIKQLHESGWSMLQLANRYNCSTTPIFRIINDDYKKLGAEKLADQTVTATKDKETSMS